MVLNCLSFSSTFHRSLKTKALTEELVQLRMFSEQWNDNSKYLVNERNLKNFVYFTSGSMGHVT